MTNILIFRTGKDQETPTRAGHQAVTVQTRDPVAYWTVLLDSETQWPDLTLVSGLYKPFLQACLLTSAETILARYIKDATKTKESIPEALFTLDALTSAATAGRMTGADLVNMWRNSHYYKMSIAPKRADAKARNDVKTCMRMDAAIEKHEDRLKALTGREPEKRLDNPALDLIMAKISPEDADTPLGEYLATRTEDVRSKLVAVDDAI